MLHVPTTKSKLLTAARQLADRGERRFDTGTLAAAAQLSPSTIERSYADLDLLLCDLLAQMDDEVRDLVAKVTLGMPAGRARLQLALDAYLQALLERPALHALAHRLRFHAEGAALIRRRVSGFNMLLVLELKACGWPHPAATARLCTAALIETAVAEAEAARKLPELRGLLLDYFSTPLP